MSKINNVKIEKQNRLHNLNSYDFKNLVFADPFEGTVPGSNPPMKYQRISILTKNEKTREVEQPDGTVAIEEDPTMPDSMGELLLLMDRSFSFGVQEKYDGYTLSIQLEDKFNPTEAQKKAVDQLEKLILACKQHLIANRKELKQPKLELCDLKNMDKLLYRKTDEDGNPIPGTASIAPKLYTCDTDNKKIKTVFYLEGKTDQDGNPIEVNPLDYLGNTARKWFKLCYVRPVLKVESIFISNQISIQLKITETIIDPVQSASQNSSLLHRQMKRK